MALDDVSGQPAPTPAARPKAKKRRSGMTEHEHLAELDGSIARILKLHERQEKRTDRLEVMLELICEQVGVKPPPRVA